MPLPKSFGLSKGWPAGGGVATAATVPPTATRTFYVSSTGSDAADGLSQATAWATAAKVNAAVLADGDIILFQGGQTFTGTLSLNPTTNIPALLPRGISVGSYGTGRATIVATSSTTYAIAPVNVDRLYVSNVILNGATGVACYVENQSQTARLNVLSFDNVDFINCNAGLDIENYNPGTTLAYPYGYNTLSITNCTLTGTGASTGNGLYMFARYNVGDPYAFGATVIRNNVVTSFGGCGCDIRCIDGLAFDHNYFGGNGGRAANLDHIELQYVNNGILQYNESVGFLGSNNAVDGAGINMDMRCSNLTVRYNYVHGNAGPGICMQQTTVGTYANIAVYMNIVQGNQTGANFGTNLRGEIVVGVPSQNNMTGIAIYNNLIICSTGTAGQNAGLYLQNANPVGFFSNNIIYATANPRFVNANGVVPANFDIQGNLYYSTSAPSWRWNATAYTTLSSWQAASNKELIAGNNVAITTDPLIPAPLTSPTLGFANVKAWNVSSLIAALSINTGSPATGSGLNLPSTRSTLDPATDFWGEIYPEQAGRAVGVGRVG
jgi:hypothetical protein